MKKIAIYPGTFDPLTNGHLDLVERALRIFDEVIIAVAPSQKKQPLFTIKERLKMIKSVIRVYRRAKVEAFNGLLVEYVEKKKGCAILRGLRAVSDFEYELQMAHMNRRLNTNIETVFMMPSEDHSFLTSSIVKEIASFGGPVNTLVPKEVESELRGKFKILGDLVE
jgi:pantetheine-phosphate adenylyltransferase